VHNSFTYDIIGMADFLEWEGAAKMELEELSNKIVVLVLLNLRHYYQLIEKKIVYKEIDANGFAKERLSQSLFLITSLQNIVEEKPKFLTKADILALDVHFSLISTSVGIFMQVEQFEEAKERLHKEIRYNTTNRLHKEQKKDFSKFLTQFEGSLAKFKYALQPRNYI
jgi:hypothetical protein